MKALASILILNGFLMCGCFRLSPDGPIEEKIEQVIRDKTGLDVDLTSEDDK